MFDRFKDKKVWAPLAGALALFGSWFTGVGVPVADAEATAEGASVLVENAETLYLAGAGILATVAGWFGLRR